MHDLLRKDYKQFQFANSNGDEIDVGISSMVKSLQWLYEEYGSQAIFEDECAKYREEHQLTMLVVMTSRTDDAGFRRELAILPEPKFQADAQKLIAGLREQLQLQDVAADFSASSTKDSNSTYKSYDQLNVAASRKQVVPYLKAAFETL